MPLLVSLQSPFSLEGLMSVNKTSTDWVRTMKIRTNIVLLLIIHLFCSI